MPTVTGTATAPVTSRPASCSPGRAYASPVGLTTWPLNTTALAAAASSTSLRFLKTTPIEVLYSPEAVGLTTSPLITKAPDAARSSASFLELNFKSATWYPVTPPSVNSLTSGNPSLIPCAGTTPDFTLINLSLGFPLLRSATSGAVRIRDVFPPTVYVPFELIFPCIFILPSGVSTML